MTDKELINLLDNDKELKNLYQVLNSNWTPKGKLEFILKIFNERENKYIKLLKYLRRQVKDSCCHTMLDEDDVVSEIDKILEDN